MDGIHQHFNNNKKFHCYCDKRWMKKWSKYFKVFFFSCSCCFTRKHIQKSFHWIKIWFIWIKCSLNEMEKPSRAMNKNVKQILCCFLFFFLVFLCDSKETKIETIKLTIRMLLCTWCEDYKPSETEILKPKNWKEAKR